MHKSDIRPFAAAALAAVAVLLSGAPLAVGAFPGRNGLIAYTEDDCGGGPQIATMRSDGTGRRLLTPRPCDSDDWGPEARAPAWSPDGRLLVFDYDDCCIEVVRDSFSIDSFALANADGSQRRLIPLPPPPYVRAVHFDRYGASFAPDGVRIVYGRAGGETNGGVAVASLDGLSDTRLGPAGAHRPRWSPDGRWIAYVAWPHNLGTPEEREGGTWLMDAQTGTHRRKIWARSALSLDWSPDSRSLLVSAHRICTALTFRCTGARLHRLSASGKGARRIVRVPRRARTRYDNGDAVWSPSGRRIAFVRERHNYPGLERQVEIWTANADGSRPRRIWKRFEGGLERAYDPNPPGQLSWQPRP